MARKSKEQKALEGWEEAVDREVDAILGRPELKALLEEGPWNAIKRGGEIFARFNRKFFPLAQQVYERQHEERSE